LISRFLKDQSHLFLPIKKSFCLRFENSTASTDTSYKSILSCVKYHHSFQNVFLVAVALHLREDKIQAEMAGLSYILFCEISIPRPDFVAEITCSSCSFTHRYFLLIFVIPLFTAIFLQYLQNRVFAGLSHLFVVLLPKENGKYEKPLVVNRTDCFRLETIQ